MATQGKPFYGKYRGIVNDNKDPLMLGRIKAEIPDVLGADLSGWAMPAVPYAGDGVGFFMIPPSGASVWIEFEHGDPDYPIWAGCFWPKEGQPPASPAVAEMKVLKTDIATITINDTRGVGSVTIETAAGMKIVLGPTGIEITDGQGAAVKLSGPQVSVNNGALEVI